MKKVKEHGWSNKKVADLFGVNYGTMINVIYGRTWVPEPGEIEQERQRILSTP